MLDLKKGSKFETYRELIQFTGKQAASDRLNSDESQEFNDTLLIRNQHKSVILINLTQSFDSYESELEEQLEDVTNNF